MKKIVAMIPARIGSQRLKKKNLALIEKKPLIQYSIEAAVNSNVFDEIYINSDSLIFSKIAKKNKIKFFNRSRNLGSSKTKSDDVVYNFIKNIKSDYIVWVNPIAPLQNPKEIAAVVKYFVKNKFNSLITTNKLKYHALYQKKPLNFKTNSKFAKTQDLKEVEFMVYSLMMWRSSSFIRSYKKNKTGILHGKVGYYPVSKYSGLIVKDIFDLKLISMLLKSEHTKFKINYFK
jgi:CMP-N-acetylneuraminic acid synthetase